MTRLALLFLLCAAAPAAAADPIEGTVVPFPAPDGWVVHPDGVTLITSAAATGELVFVDTVTEQERRVAVDFKPGALALQGNTLFAAAKGGAVVYALDAKTGAVKKTIPLAGADAVAHLACHPAKGLVYASTTSLGVYAIDPAAGAATKTTATGSFLAVDPVNAAFLITGVQPPRDQEELVIKDLPGGRYKIFWDRWGTRAFVLKYAIAGKELKLASSQKNAAVNAYSLAVSPDGKKALLSSGGGWRPPVEGGSGGGYVCAAFDTDNLETMLGQAPAATNLAFHPVLNLGVLNQQGKDIQLFNPKSLVGGKTFAVAKGADARPLLVAFGGKGTKVILWNGDNPANPQEGLHFLPLELTAADRAELRRAYGVLPAGGVAAKPDPKTPAPKPTPGKTPAAEAEAAGPAGLIATAGFNAAKGLNAAAGRAAYPLGKANAPGGIGEKGWQGLWPAAANAKYVTDPTAEGDGAVWLTAGNFARTWSKPQAGVFRVELMARVPAGGGVMGYVWGEREPTTGPVWRITAGKFQALDGTGFGSGNWTAVADCPADTWHKVTLGIDVAKQQWTLATGDAAPSKAFGFRYKAPALQTLNFLVEGKEEAYLDAVRVLAGDGK